MEHTTIHGEIMYGQRASSPIRVMILQNIQLGH